MATYEQWQAAAAKGNVKRVTWVCGPELVLVQEVKSTFFAAARNGSPALCHGLVFTAGEDAEEDIWDACYSYPFTGERNLVLVREAQRLEHMDRVIALSARELRDVWVLFVSSEDGYDRKLPKEEGGGRKMFPGPAAVQELSCGQLVKCVISEKDKLAWFKRNVPGIQESAAVAVLEKTGHSMTLLADVAAKAAASRWPISEAALLMLVDERLSASSFEDDLIRHRKRDALSHLPPPEDWGRLFALLSSRLDVLALLHAHQGETARELEMSVRVPRMFVAAYRQVASQYPPSRVRSCRQVLATLDVAWRHGARTGLGEALVAQW